MKIKFTNLIAIFLISISIFLVGCNKEDDWSGCSLPTPYIVLTDDINVFLNDWYSVQKGIVTRNGENSAKNDKMIECFSPYTTVTYPILKNSDFVLFEAEAYGVEPQEPLIMKFYYNIAGEERYNDKKSIEVRIFIFPSEENLPSIYKYNNIIENVYDKEYNAWAIDNGVGYIYIMFPEMIDASDPDIIYEYFEFETLSVAEYESKLRKEQ